MRSAVAQVTDFSDIRYAQVWEDADVLLGGLDVQPGDVCLSIASAGDNALALLTRDPSRVIAVDLSCAQLACLELRVAAFRILTHGELLELVGSRPSVRRAELYRRCRSEIGPGARAFWDSRPVDILNGIGSAGKFERYLELFRRRVLPLVHQRETVQELLKPATVRERKRFYEDEWDTLRWRLMFRTFFSRPVLGPARARHRLLPLRGRGCSRCNPPTNEACIDGARSGVQSLRPLDPHRHARGRAAVRLAGGELRHHSSESRQAGVARGVARGVPAVDPPRRGSIVST